MVLTYQFDTPMGTACEYGGKVIDDPSSFSNYGGKYTISGGGSSASYIQDANRLSALGLASDAVIAGEKRPTITWSAVETTERYKVRFYSDEDSAYLQSEM